MKPSVLLKHVARRHSEVADRLKGELASEAHNQTDVNKWIVCAMVTARSSDYVAACTVLTAQRHSEAAMGLARTVLEDAAVLGYIASKKKQADFAELYGQSDILDRAKMQKQMVKMRPELEAKHKDELARWRKMADDYVARGAQLGLWPAEKEFDRLRSWNDRTLRDSFDKAGMGLVYDTWYSECCQFSHASAFALSRGFVDTLPMDDPVRTAAADGLPDRVRQILALGLFYQLKAVNDLTGCQPSDGLNALEQFLQEALAETRDK